MGESIKSIFTASLPSALGKPGPPTAGFPHKAPEDTSFTPKGLLWIRTPENQCAPFPTCKLDYSLFPSLPGSLLSHLDPGLPKTGNGEVAGGSALSVKEV